MHGRITRFFGTSLAACLLFGALSTSYVAIPAGAAALPAGFTDTVVFSGLTEPTKVAFAPNGKVFVAEKGGRVLQYDGISDSSATLVKDLSTNVYNLWERGLLGLAVDPRFGDGTGHDFVYVAYAKDAPPGQTPPVYNDRCTADPEGDETGCVVAGRLSRIPVATDGTGGTEQILIDDEWCQQFTSHSTGDLQFGPDGNLYMSAGEGAGWLDDLGDHGQSGNACGDPPSPAGTALAKPTAEGGALRAQSVRRAAGPVLLSGTVIRVDPDTGAGVPDNPMYDGAAPTSNASRIVAYGFRNPFRFNFRPGTSELWVGNVGWGSWEEVDRIANPLASPAYNSGWPCLENQTIIFAYRGLDSCEELIPGNAPAASDPYFAYRHSEAINANDTCPIDTGTALSGQAFLPGDNYGAAYKNAFFFGDVAKNCILYMPAGDDGLPDTSIVQVFVDDSDNPFAVDLEVDPTSGDLFYVSIAGAVHRISHVPVNTAAPSITPATAPQIGTVLTANLGTWTGSPTITYTYQWKRCATTCADIGTATANAHYTVTAADVGKKLRVTVSATNIAGNATADSPDTPTVANDVPVVTITTPAAGTTWTAGQQISFSGTATDPDGTIEHTQWQIVYADCHTGTCAEQTLATPTGLNGTVTVPASSQAPAHIEFRLTATDNVGDAGAATPRTIDGAAAVLTVQSNPSGLALTAGTAAAQATPFSQTWVAGSPVQVSAPATQALGAVTYTFAGWSDGGAATHTVAATSATYSANYSAPAPPPPPPPVTQSVPAGYWMIGGHGSVYAFGNVPNLGNAPTTKAVDLEPTPDGTGYWVVDGDGHVFAYGNAPALGNAGGLPPGETVTSLSRTKSGNGYWIFTNRGRVVPFGDAPFFGDMRGIPLNGPVLDSVSTPSGNGYYMVASDGGVFSFGDAAFHGSMGGQRLNAPVQSLVPDGDGAGYWLVASDGGIFAFDAAFHGSMGGQRLNRPVTGMVRFGDGYLMVGEDGGIFNFSNQPFYGSLGSTPPAVPIVSVAASG